MNFNDFKIKITRGGSLVFEKGSGKSSDKKKSRLVSYSKYTQPLNKDKQNALLAGGWNQEDVNRMMTAKPKMKVYSDGGYAYI